MASYRGVILTYIPISDDIIECVFENGSIFRLNADLVTFLIGNGVFPASDPEIFSKRHQCTEYFNTSGGRKLYESLYLGHGVVRVTNKLNNNQTDFSIERYQQLFGPDGPVKILQKCINIEEYNVIGYLYQQESARAAEERRRAMEEEARKRAPVSVQISKRNKTVTVKRGDEVVLEPMDIDRFVTILRNEYLMMDGSVVIGVRENSFGLTLENVTAILEAHSRLAAEDRETVEEERGRAPVNVEISGGKVKIMRGGKLLLEPTDINIFVEILRTNYIKEEGRNIVGVRPNPFGLTLENVRKILDAQARFAEEEFERRAGAEAEAGPAEETVESLKEQLARYGITDKKSFQRFIVTHHPDKFQGKPEAAEMGQKSTLVSDLRKKLRAKGITDYGFMYE